MSENENYVGAIVRSIVDTGELDNANWSEFSLVIGFDDDGDPNQTYGYAFSAEDDWIAISCKPRLIATAAVAYRDWLGEQSDKPFIKMLVQFNRDSGRYNVDLEYEDESRLKVTPANIHNVIEQLRPNLGD